MSPLGVPARQSTNPPVIQSQSLESAPCYLKNLPIRHSVAVAKERTCYPGTRAERASIARRLHACGMHQSLDGAMY